MDSTAWNHQDDSVLTNQNQAEKSARPRWLIKALLGIAAVNLIFLNVMIVKQQLGQPAKTPAEVSLEQPSETSETTEMAQIKKDLMALDATVAAKLSCVVSPLPLADSSSSKSITPKLLPQLATLNFPGGQSANATDWWNTPNLTVTFNAANYPNYTAYWGALLMVKGSEGKAYARLFDVQANAPIAGSEIETSSSNLVRVSSGAINFWPANRTYRIQLKSLLGAEIVVEDAKIVISWIKEE
ncbi:hypothetical protein A2160_05665 [Candidatus Beckwithbacteria bacterium RBG_13_42_9]|uniref:Uncharacterized protein n=1 Tax=Candidatus Beckwithbacteria bacterium RBG_13_42_9 TaxID=1797457 RepID=A0A1F5E644_9BACT|nr:MAG: hypothetical protein A2160_05665 [Candidatus Beckwithbacteria bacterium RBG_13_42_9]